MEPPTGTGIKRLNWGCGPRARPGWINSDRRTGEGIDLSCDILHGLPLESDGLDYIVSIHALQDLAYADVLPALRELRRILKPGGVLRLGLPDLDRAIRAYLRHDHAYFYVPHEDARSIGGKLVTQMIWYGSIRTPMTSDFLEEWLQKAEFTRVNRCGYQETKSRYPEIVELDNRERESLFAEAVK